jgi:pimeloyl-ACP methyl ester carboxylesterase
MQRVTTLLASMLALALFGCAAKKGRAFRDLDYPMTTRIVPVGNAEIAVHEQGKGERTVVLIHGLGSYMPVWTHNLDALARDHRVIAIDLPGYGKSSKANHSYSMEFFAQAVHAVVKELGVTRPVLVGHSMGGQIAITYALVYPDEVDALVLTSPAGLEAFEDGEARWLSEAVSPTFTCAADAEAIWVRHAQNFYRPPQDADFMVKDRVAVIGGPDFEDYCRAVSRSVSAMVDEPVLDRLGEIDVPVLVLFGEEDALIPNPILHGGSTVKLAKKAVKEFPDAELVLLEKAGHMAQFEQSRSWNSKVLGFLASHSSSPAEPGKRAKKHRGKNEFVPLFDDPPAHTHEAAPAPEPTPTPPEPPAKDPAPPADVPSPPAPAPDQPVAPMTEEGPR